MIGSDIPDSNSHEDFEKLKAGNQLLKRNLQSINSIMLASTDVAYKMNADWTKLLELHAPNFLAASDEPNNDWIDKYILPEERPKLQMAIQEAIKEKRMFELELSVFTVDGSPGWALSKAIPVFNEAGEITEWLGLATDISTKKNAELALRKLIEEHELLSRLYETIMDNTPDLVYVFDLDGRFNYANKALLNMWGRSKENSIGKSLLEVGYEPWHAAMHEREIAEIKITKESIRGEVAFPHATLGKRIYDYILVPVLNAKGEVSAVAGTTRDITAIKKLSQQKDEFLDIASHELKTPLTTLKAYGQVLQSIFEKRNDAESVMMLSRMDKQINKLTSLITDLLDVSRINSGKLLFNQELFDLSAITADIVDGLQLTTNKHTIQKELPAKAIFYGDADRIGQVINNLVGNAIKYSPDGGAIKVSLKQQGTDLLLCVQDSGIGIPAGMQTKVFEQFYRADNYNETIPGMGIGLYISAQIVERCGGRIWAESVEGAGATFCVSLPIATNQ